MDPLIDNDSHGLHWTLSPAESRHLLEAIFPDSALFSHTTGPPELLNMTWLLDSLQDQGIYKRSGKNESAECWHQFSSCHRKSAKSSMARFLNGILTAAQKVVGKSSVQRLVSLSHPTTCIDVDAQNMACQRSNVATQRLGCKSQARPHTIACIGCQFIRRFGLEGHYCLWRDEVQKGLRHTEKVLHWSSRENCTSPLHAGWKALSTMPPNSGPSHHHHIFRPGEICFNHGVWYPWKSWSFPMYFTQSLYCFNGRYRVRWDSILGWLQEEEGIGHMEGGQWEWRWGQSTFIFETTDFYLRHITWSWYNGLGHFDEGSHIPEIATTGHYQGLVDWPPVEIHGRQPVSQAQQCKHGKCSPPHTRTTGAGTSPLTRWSRNEHVDALPLYPSVVQPSIPTMHPLTSCDQAVWETNYVFLFPCWASGCIHWLCPKYVPTRLALQFAPLKIS